MPYVNPQARHEINKGRVPKDCGELNYLLTVTLLQAHLHSSGAYVRDDLRTILQMYVRQFSPLRYQIINDVSGACANAALEMERRLENPEKAEYFAMLLAEACKEFYQTVGVSYEKTKIQENGDIVYV